MSLNLNIVSQGNRALGTVRYFGGVFEPLVKELTAKSTSIGDGYCRREFKLISRGQVMASDGCY